MKRATGHKQTVNNYAVWRKVRRMANQLGMRVRCRESQTPIWDGCTLRVRKTPRSLDKEDVWDLLHEIAHFQCAEPGRRHRENYGLGMDYQGTGTLHAIPGVNDLTEEVRASLLGILWARHLKHDWQGYAEFHDWSDNDNITRMIAADEDQHIVWLRSRGLVVRFEPQLILWNAHSSSEPCRSSRSTS